MSKANGIVFKVESGLPMPGPRESTRVYPFASMKVGDSFAFPAGRHVTVTPAACYWGKRHQQKFAIRKDGDGYRCWRIE